MCVYVHACNYHNISTGHRKSTFLFKSNTSTPLLMIFDLNTLRDKKKLVCMSSWLFYRPLQDCRAIPHAQRHNLIACARINCTILNDTLYYMCRGWVVWWVELQIYSPSMPPMACYGVTFTFIIGVLNNICLFIICNMLRNNRSTVGVTNKLTYRQTTGPHFVRYNILPGVTLKIQFWYRVFFIAI